MVRIFSGLGRGLWLLAGDVHRLLFRRMGDRVWWLYFVVVVVAFLWATGRLWDIMFSILAIVIMSLGFWLIVRPLFRGAGRREKR